MRIKYFLIIVLGTLACMLVTDGLVLQPLTKQDSNLVFAKQPPDVPKGPKDPKDPSEGPKLPIGLPEPSTLILLGTGLTSIGVYFYSKKRNEK